MVIPSQGWYKVWANRLTFSKLEKTCAETDSDGVFTNFCRMLINNIYMWSVLFGFFVGLAVWKWMDNLWNLPFIYPIVLYVWCLSVGGVFTFFLFLKVCPFSNFPQTIHVNVCLVRSRDSYPAIGYIIQSCIIVHTSMSMSTQGVQPPGDRGDVADVAKEKRWFHNWLQQKKLLHLGWISL